MPTTPKKTLAQKMADYAALLTNLASSADTKYRQNINNPLYLWGEMRGDIWRKLWVWDETEAEGDLVFAETLPRGLTIEHLAHWLRERLRREPLYVFLDQENP
jgi:hypothetical protein